MPDHTLRYAAILNGAPSAEGARGPDAVLGRRYWAASKMPCSVCWSFASSASMSTPDVVR